MLEQVLQHLNNWFLVPDGIHSGEFTGAGRRHYAALPANRAYSGWWGLSLMMASTNTRQRT